MYVRTESAIARFERLYIPEPNSGCWIWMGAYNKKTGYGGFKGENSKQMLAHRFSYEFYEGLIPDELVIDHWCNNRLCVNPDHLRVVTQSYNVRRYTDLITHCPQGHAYYGDNVKLNNGSRICVACHNIYMNDYNKSKRSPATGPENKNKTHCPQGHEYTAENTKYSSKGQRSCRTCHRIYAACKRAEVLR